MKFAYNPNESHAIINDLTKPDLTISSVVNVNFLNSVILLDTFINSFHPDTSFLL